MAEVQYRIAATEGGTALLSGSAPVVSGTWSQALTLPAGIADGATWWLGRRGIDDAGNAEAWKWASFVLAVEELAGATSEPARWWIEAGQAPHVRATHETTWLAAGRPQVAWVTSTPERAGSRTTLLDVDVPVEPQTAWEAYLEDTTNTGVRVAESGVVAGTGDRWSPTGTSLVPGRVYKGWARARVGTTSWSPWASTRFVVPTGKVLYFEDFGAVGDGVALDGTDYRASPSIGTGPVREAMRAAAPGDVVRSKKPGHVRRGIAATGTQLTGPAGTFTTAMVGKKALVYGAGYYDGPATYTAAQGTSGQAGYVPASVAMDPTRTAVHRSTVQAVSADGTTATLAAAVATARATCKVVIDYPTYLINHIDVDGGLGGTNAGRGWFTLDGTGCVFTASRETSAGFRTTLPGVAYVGVHYHSLAAGFRGDDGTNRSGQNSSSGPWFFEGAGAVGNRTVGCWAERANDAGFLWFNGPADQHVIDCYADHTNADPFHVTATANDIYFIRAVSIWCGDDLGNIGYRSNGDSNRPFNIYWESPRTYGQDWGRSLAYGGTHHALATDVVIDGGAMANFLVGSDGDQANTADVQIRGFRITRSRQRTGQKAYYSQGPGAGTINDGMWLKLLVNKGTATVRQARILIEKGHVTDGKYLQVVCYGGGEFEDATTILRGIVMDGDVNAGLSWVDQGTYPNHLDLRGVTPVGRTAITAAPTASNGTPPGSAASQPAPA